VPDPDATTPPAPDPDSPSTPTRPRRARKFSLPKHHHVEGQDDRTDEHIEAFLTPRPRRRRPKATDRVRRPIELDTRPDWMTALRHETARQERYGRPASVLLIELAPDPEPASEAAANGEGANGHGTPTTSGLDVLARFVADAIRAQARESDRAVRYGATSFRLLLPETGDRAARAVGQRIDRAVMANAEHLGKNARLTIDVAYPARAGTLEDAVADAERRLAARLAEGHLDA
jgi:hypothetical protein